MTERTHDLAGLTALTLAFVFLPLTPMNILTLITILIVNQIGSAFPDLDQPTAEFYRELPVGSFIGKLISPLMGSHRLLSHSLVGLSIIGYLFNLLLNYLNTFILLDMKIIWWSFIFGYISHLIADTLTKEGVPWLFPLPIKFGFPPFRFLRMKTGEFMEKYFAYPLLVVLNCYLLYQNYDKVVDFFTNYISK